MSGNSGIGNGFVALLSNAGVPSAMVSGGVALLCFTGMLLFDPNDADSPRLIEVVFEWVLVLGFIAGIAMTLLIAWRQSGRDLAKMSDAAPVVTAEDRQGP
jgi:hypothetical protein